MFGHGVNINAAAFKISNGLRPELASLIPNLASVIERSTIIDNRAVERPTATRDKGAERWHGAAVKEADGLSERAAPEMAHELDGVAAPTTATAIPNLLTDIDRKPVTTPASRAGSD
jgi:hypothetical protein